LICPAGSFAAVPGDTVCTPSPAGSFVPTAGATSATLCAAGTFQSLTGQISCDDSPAGSFVPTAGATSATTCPVDNFCPAGSTTPSMCPTGTSSPLGSGSLAECIAIDTTAPTFDGLISTNIAEATGPDGAIVNYSLPPVSDDTDPAPILACTPVPGSLFSLGDTAVTCTATDSSGNSASQSFTVTVEDTTSPFISLPGDVTVELGQLTTPSSTGQATASDLVDLNPSVTFSDSITPGTGNIIQIITRTWTATDASGNTDSGIQTITIQDTTAPVFDLTTVNDVTVTGDSTGAIVNYVTPSATDLSGITITCTPPSGSQLPLGDTAVTCTATDDVGNVSTISFNITVNANTGEPTSREIKQGVIDKLQQLKADSDDKKTDKRLDKAITSVQKSLDAKLWADDSHLTKKGEKVFESEKKAVKELQKLLGHDDEKDNDKHIAESLDLALVQMGIDDLCKADQTLSQTAIDDVNQPDNEKIVDANKKMDKAQSELDKNRCDKAIDNYKDAWKKAQDVLKDDDEHDDKKDKKSKDNEHKDKENDDEN